MSRQVAPDLAFARGDHVLALQGWDVAVTSARRGRDLVALLAQRGARVHHVPAVRTVPLEHDQERLAATERCLEGGFDVVVATTGVGFTAWLDAADGWGLGEQLREALAGAAVYARGPKARGALLAAGLEDASELPCDSSWEVLEQLLGRDLRGRRVVVQLHGAAIDDFSRILGTAGAEVVEVPIYRSLPPDDGTALEQLVRRLAARELHAVSFTSAAATNHVLDAAERSGLLDPLLDALTDGVHAGCVGPVAAAPLERLGAPVVMPAQPRLGALAHALAVALERSETALVVAGRSLRVRGSGAVVDEVFRPLAPAPMALLRTLAQEPGRVLSPLALAAALPGEGDGHAVEMTVSRLRAALGDGRTVHTVVKRGYRLQVDHVVETHDQQPQPAEQAVPPLLEVVGGTAAVREAVERLYVRLLEEPLVRHFFAEVDMPRLKRHQVLLVSELLGGPPRYRGRELAEAHAGMGITAEQYQCVLQHLTEVLQELEVDPSAAASVIGALQALEGAVRAQ